MCCVIKLTENNKPVKMFGSTRCVSHGKIAKKNLHNNQQAILNFGSNHRNQLLRYLIGFHQFT